MNHKIVEIMNSMETYQLTYPEDACIVVADTEKVVAYLPGKKVDLKVKVGTPIEMFKGTVAYKAFETGKVVQEERGPEQFGMAYISSGVPIRENGKVIGVICAVVSSEQIDTLRTSATELSATVEEMSATTQEVSSASADMAHRLQGLLSESENMINDIKEIHSVLAFVQDVASQSHMLGLNAAIEAARAGEHGRGFSVVANEIRKMAEQSKVSAKNIHDQLQHIQDAVIKINDTIQQVASYTQQHSASMQELHHAFDHIAQTADRLVTATK
ncbi:methyl-accepting chemotaxis protein [Brevibacillus sp. SYSU BS000544]|uniref:methyl-accepting chemotaxis protein n=1 Tax=Brevibacillus sp. SYSU BS000544 TaxID=3416443 RepID=UPI003CE5BFCD